MRTNNYAALELSFGSDNHSGVHPAILEAIERENQGFRPAYGEEEYTRSVLEQIEVLSGGACSAYFVLNGTGANVVALSCFAQSWNAILCPDTAHINVDECGAVEKNSGAKLVPMASVDGKVTVQEVEKHLVGFGFQHHSQPQILSISQPTELGTLYSTDEVKALAALMHSHGGFLHIDGSRISNAAASTGLSVKELTADCNADVLSFGGTKNGLLMGEAVVVFRRGEANRKAAEALPYLRKQATQLYSKSRFIATQFEAYLKEGLYLKNAANANSMARYMKEQLSRFTEITITRPVDCNAVFATMPSWLSSELLKKYYFYFWDEEKGEVRWMCSFNTTRTQIDLFVADVERTIKLHNEKR